MVRQQLAARFVAENLPHLGRPLDILDAGCGQGTQSIRLALAGHRVVGLDGDGRMLDAFREAIDDLPPEAAARITVAHGLVESASATFGTAAFDAVMCHGVLMYVPDPWPLVESLAAALRPGGIVSVIARNQHGIAVRAGHRQRWTEALAAVHGDPAYVNELGVAARADTVDALSAMLHRAGLETVRWYGIRTLSDSATLDARPPQGDELEHLLSAEDAAGRTDPYRLVAPLFQLIARSPQDTHHW